MDLWMQEPVTKASLAVAWLSIPRVVAKSQTTRRVCKASAQSLDSRPFLGTWPHSFLQLLYEELGVAEDFDEASNKFPSHV